MQDLIELLQEAVVQAASDLYLFPDGQHYKVQLRTPLGLTHLPTITQERGRQWINYLKYQAGMSTTEHRRVQLGRVRLDAVAAFMRLSSVGDYQGQEAMVIRLISGVPPLDDYSKPVIDQLRRSLTGGMLAVAGPTGAGKTTLLYQLAQTYAAGALVMTIEDPVEIIEPAFLQLQVNPDADMSYLALLKAALRQRPDVLVIGELRDQQTAAVACEAALSGHLVLTTVHAASAVSVPERLISMGVAPAMVQAALQVSARVALIQEPVVHPVVEVKRWKEGFQ